MLKRRTPSRRRKPSPQTAAVILALADAPEQWRYGYDLCQQLGLQAGTIYPILMRLADGGLLEATWEADVPPGRPPRHLYRLTGDGLAAARELTQTREHAQDGARVRRRAGLEGAP